MPTPWFFTNLERPIRYILCDHIFINRIEHVHAHASMIRRKTGIGEYFHCFGNCVRTQIIKPNQSMNQNTMSGRFRRLSDVLIGPCGHRNVCFDFSRRVAENVDDYLAGSWLVFLHTPREELPPGLLPAHKIVCTSATASPSNVLGVRSWCGRHLHRQPRP